MSDPVCERPPDVAVAEEVEWDGTNPISKNQQATARDLARKLRPPEPSEQNLRYASSRLTGNSKASEARSLLNQVVKRTDQDIASLRHFNDDSATMNELEDYLSNNKDPVDFKTFTIFAVSVIVCLPLLIWGVFTVF